MSRITGSLAISNDTVVLAQDVRAKFAVFTFSGTYASPVLAFEALDGSVAAPVEAVQISDYAPVTGNFSPANNASVSYLVFAPGISRVRVRLVSIGSGSVSVRASAGDDTFGELTLPPAGTTVSVAVAAASGAIGLRHGTVFVTAASAAALTLAAPSAGADDGKRLTIISTTAQAHTVTNTTPGFNSGGTASDVATFGTAIGNGMVVVAYNGVWYVESLRNVTLG